MTFTAEQVFAIANPGVHITTFNSYVKAGSVITCEDSLSTGIFKAYALM